MTRLLPRTALSIRQPWAWLIVRGYKDVENRTWPTYRRGRVLIHAPKTFDLEGWEWVRTEFPQIPVPGRGSFDLGGVVGEAKIMDCVQEMDSPWFFGPYGFVMLGRSPLPFHPCRGQRGFFRVEVPA